MSGREGSVPRTEGGAEAVPVEVFLGLGSNLDDRAEHLGRGLRRIQELGNVRGVSGVYETAPEGFTGQPPFLNLVVQLESILEPLELLEATRGIERDRGRIRTFRNAPRTLDIDLLLFGSHVFELPGLTVPHPRMNERLFVLVPLLELAPTAADPRTGRRYAELLADLTSVEEPGNIERSRARRVMNGEELLDGEGA